MQRQTIFAIFLLIGFFVMKCSKGWPLGGGILHHKDLGGGKEILIEEEWRAWFIPFGYATRLWYRTGPEELWAYHWIHSDDQDRWTEEPEVRWSHGSQHTDLRVHYRGKRHGYGHLRVPAEESTWLNFSEFDLDPDDQPDWPVASASD